jgi:acyl phosphate:glycerol-3-phosphate acyltransferase
MAFVIVALLSYLIGSIPTGFLVGRIAGIDIRKTGSGNIGATNVTRVLGKRYGYPVFLADFCKGLAAVGVSTLVCKQLFMPANGCQLLQIVGAIFCVVGNAFPVWLKFHGGKGVSTSAGVLFALTPLAAMVGVVVWIVTFKITRYVSVASIAAAIALPIAVVLIMRLSHTEGSALFYFTISLAVVVILRHRSNLSRLLKGTEQRFQKSED